MLNYVKLYFVVSHLSNLISNSYFCCLFGLISYGYHSLFIFVARYIRSSRFARLQSVQCSIAGKNLYIRFTCSTGDAMGMNMVSKGVQNVLDFLHIDFPDMEVIGISGEPPNFF